jgi:hypothetical protein
MTETVDRLMRAVKPPYGEEWHNYLSIHSHLLSAAACLAHSRFLLGNRVPRRSSWGFHLYEELQSAISEFGYVEWHKVESTQLFGIEVLLNAAQSSIAAAVDASVNAWIIERMEDIEEKTSFDEQLLGLWIGVRLRILGSALAREIEPKLPPDTRGIFPWYDEQIPQNMEEPAYSHGLWKTFERYSNTIIAEQEIHHLASRYIKQISWPAAEYVDEDREQILMYLWNHMQVSKAGSAAIVLSRVNAFKHLIKGVSDRYDFVYAVEWVVTAKALEWISAFWGAMIFDVKRPESSILQEGGTANAITASENQP